ncbi:MAG: nitrate reductase cytochrome c-type subunit [Rhodocyclaceae bacterium]|nr:nitrate reductase cytochrome c-type subunit [Rhodocyclaceae bacterium]
MTFPLKTTFAAILAAAAWALAPQAIANDTAQSMRGADVAAADPAPEAKKYLGGKPGGQQKVARTFKGQPPVIPHAVDNFDEITLEENQCLSCHSETAYKKKNAPRIGDSHFLDRDGKKLESAYAGRHNCVQCHVPQVDAPPLVENTFVGSVAESTAAPTKKR